MENFIVLRNTETETRRVVEYSDLDFIPFMRTASKHICFSDITCENPELICYNGRELVYSGWQPGMCYSFCWADNNEDAYEGYFPEWDH